MSEISKLEQNLIIKKIDKETTNIQVTNNEILISIVGQFDQNLKNLSKIVNGTNSIFDTSINSSKELSILSLILLFSLVEVEKANNSNFDLSCISNNSTTK
jgi:hypothetical protein